MNLYQYIALKKTTGDRFFGIAVSPGAMQAVVRLLDASLGKRCVSSLSSWKLWAWALPLALQLHCHCHGCFIWLQKMLKTFTIFNFGFKGTQKSYAVHSRHKHDCRVKYHSWASVRLQQMLGQKINDYRPWKFIVIQDHVVLHKDLPLPDHRSPQLSGKQGIPQLPQMKDQ